MFTKSCYRFTRLFLDYLIYIVPFVIFHWIHFHTLPLTGVHYCSFFIIYSFIWLLSTIIAQKVIYDNRTFAIGEVRSIILSFIIMIGIYSAYNIIFADAFHSRSVFIFSAVSGFVIEILLTIQAIGVFSYIKSHVDLSLPRFILEVCTFLAGFATFYLYVAHHYSTIITLEHFSLIFFVWLIAGILSGIFTQYRTLKGMYFLIWQVLKNNIYFFLLSSFVVFYFTPIMTSPRYFLHNILIYSIISIMVDIITYLGLRPQQSDEIASKTINVPIIEDNPLQTIMGLNSDKYFMPESEEISHSFDFKLHNIYLSNYPEVYSFIASSLELNSIDVNYAIAIRTNDMYNVDILPNNYLSFFCNLLDINNLRYLNRYFIEVNNKLKTGGIFIGSLEPTHLRFKHFMQKYPFYLARILYFIDFMWKRVMPKLPLTKHIYFSLTKGRNRAISLAESLGRLYYCGFEVISIREIDQRVFFIAHKSGNPKEDKNPSYGPLFKMKRIGKDGKPIFVFKLRTMHPYSEYLQKFMYDHNNLADGGKFHRDFRITSWGKFFRKIWVDELPMIINWFKGDLKLVGVRPISQHYLSLYPAEVRERRTHYKPGLVPPFYADMPTTLDEIIQSELNYMNAYDESPFKADVKYFFKAFNNIIFKRARSK
jgi:lipopolysaccharide/colanic/teichoic acid biosynthesis glycosyltransferase